MAIAFWSFRNWRMLKKLSNYRKGLEIGRHEKVNKKQGLIVPLSVGKGTPAELAINYHMPVLKHCWLLTTEDTKNGIEGLKNSYPEIQFHPFLVEDPNNPKFVLDTMENVYDNVNLHGLKEKDTIADYTGGTKSMSAGMVIAASRSLERDLQYLYTSPKGKDSATGQAIRSEAPKNSYPILIDFSLSLD